MRLVIGVLLALVTVVAVACGSGDDNDGGNADPSATQPAGSTQPATGDRMQYSAEPPMTIDQNKQYFATIKTEVGDIKLELYPKDAPRHVNSFVFLAREGFYDGTTFHRVINDFMIQGGDPTGTGRGGPGYKFDDEFGPKSRKHQKGSLSMANAGPNTNGSQFFITHGVTGWLDGKHVVFGQVTKGQDVVDKVQQGDTIKSLTITES